MYESLKSRYIPGYSAVQSSSSTPRPEPIAAPGTIPITLRYTLCSVTACVIAACVTTPIEVVQARWQTSGGKIQGGVSEIVKQMWKTGGPMAFTRGLGIRIAYAVRCSSLHSSASPCSGLARTLTSPLSLFCTDPSQRHFDDGLRIGQAVERAQLIPPINSMPIETLATPARTPHQAYRF